ncbi:hypothetical protein LTR41_004651 [Exophiala xenobiotica]|uniref:Uncharacterized protein n=1 Tax=Vermiconidia calcicola TaxID=1690605 RepID=A0AAV9QG48_9PEZI|nr:hypothetical protein LTR41_004651 [Exophiala xenobiotica]KAK5542334.1 hypothetical protein LTR25_002219 [Vermiconidia calcicola]KAK5546192.1 hypothetical protein LTR23_003643 [Chaetothyriales sp. CCFEE 6169]KAK5341385.1 hypothetical protein LTR98_002177 [Exophiala xenobiotica]KAK5424778.1 hypothetical protein LTR90_000368 [Exophiala xenobiotica]
MSTFTEEPGGQIQLSQKRGSTSTSKTTMPLATIHLLSLTPSTSIPSFLDALNSTSDLQPLVVSKVIRWVITPTKIDLNPLLHPSKPWDLLIIVPGSGTDASALPQPLASKVQCHWSTVAGIPSRLTQSFSSTNARILHPEPSQIPPLTGALDNPRLGTTSQTLELSPDLSTWIKGFSQTPTGKTPLSMLNLLAFKPGLKESYLKYGKAFAESIGSRRGGNAKLVGNIVPQQPSSQSQSRSKKDRDWDEFALASYPSILHFADMLASEDYQAVNLKYRVPALEDTLILCTSEVEIEEIMKGRRDVGIGKSAAGSSKL